MGADGEPLTNLIVWMDGRGLAQVDRLNAIIGAAEYYETSGHPIVPITGVSKILWLQQEAPQLWDRIEFIGAPQTQFLRWLGCDRALVDVSSGSYLFPNDIREREWSAAIADALSFPLEKLPALVPSTEIVGELGKKAAVEMGLPTGIPIVAGGGDGQCAAAGSGIIEPGYVMVNIGTATGVQVYLAEPKFDVRRTLNCAAHVIPGAWEMEGHTQASGTVFRWFRDEFAATEVQQAEESSQDAYDLLADQASEIPAGAEGLIFFPTFNGSTAPIIDPYARGALLGMNLSHTRSHIIRAMLEGISFEIRWMLDTMKEADVSVDVVRLAGGGSKNDTWNAIHADIFNRPVSVIKNPEAALVGAAMCATVALGAYPNFQDAAQSFVEVGETIEPQSKNQAVYQKSYDRYVDLFKLLSQEQAFVAEVAERD